MDKKCYKILTASHKGGVGKTMVSINVAAALKSAGYDVLLIDTDTANPSIGPLLGLPDSGPGYAEIIDGKNKIDETLVVVEPYGFYIIPAGGNGDALATTTEQTNKFFEKLSKLNFDFIIIDTPPGTATDGALKNYDEALIVTTPEETAVLGAKKLSQKFINNHLQHKLIINRMKKDKYELDEEKIEKMYGDVAYSIIPEDEIIEESEAKHTPAYMINRKSAFSVAVDDLIRSYALRAGEPGQGEKPKKGGFGGVKRFFGGGQ